VNLGFPFERTYELAILDRIRRQRPDERVLSFPGAESVDWQQELAEGPIVRVEPHGADSWIGIFHGGDMLGSARSPAEVLSWPGGGSFCVLQLGLAVRVNAHDPLENEVIAVEPVTGVRAVPEAALVLFADFTSLACYAARGLVWRSERLAWDDVRIESVDVEGGSIMVRGFDAPANDVNAAFTVDLATGASVDKPYDRPDG
jgi:hypothetical protein